MSQRLALPLSQQRHSNVAIVKVKHDGVTLEVPAYKNKVLAYRQGLETDLDEVLQISRVFTNVSRGEFASKDDIRKALKLGNKAKISEDAAIRKILETGEVQVSADERKEEEGVLKRDVITIVAQKCIHPVTRRPYPFSIIENALTSIGFSVRLDQDAKPQANRAMKDLCSKQILPIRRAPMRIRICTTKAELAVEYLKKVEAENVFVRPIVVSSIPEENINKNKKNDNNDDDNDNDEGNAKTTTVERKKSDDIVADVSPELFRVIDQWVASELPEGSSVTVIIPCVVDTSEGDASAISSEASSKFASSTATPSAQIIGSGKSNNFVSSPPISTSKAHQQQDRLSNSSSGQTKATTAAALKNVLKNNNDETTTNTSSNNNKSNIASSTNGGGGGAGKKLTAKQRAQLRKQNREQQQQQQQPSHKSSDYSDSLNNVGGKSNNKNKKLMMLSSSDDDDDSDDDGKKKKKNNKKGKKKHSKVVIEDDEQQDSGSESDSDSDSGLTRKEKQKKKEEKERREQEERERQLEEDEEAWKEGALSDDDE